MFRAAVSIALIILLGLEIPLQAFAQKKTAPQVVPEQTSVPQPTTFISEDAKTCQEAFGPQAPPNLSPGVLEICRRAADSQRDQLSARMLAVAYLSGQHGLPRNKPEGLRLLSAAARDGQCQGSDPLTYMYLGLLLYNGEAWVNTDTHHEEPMNLGDPETVARKAIRMNEGASLVACVKNGRDPRMAQLAQQMLASMHNPIMDHYNPARDGDSSVRFHAYQSPYANGGGSTSSSTDTFAAVAGAAILLGLIGAATSGSSNGTSAVPTGQVGVSYCTKRYQVHHPGLPGTTSEGWDETKTESVFCPPGVPAGTTLF